MSEVKLLTCCYCGARETLLIRKAERRALACRACGAAIRKVTPVHLDGTPCRTESPRPVRPAPPPMHAPPPPHKRKQKKGKRRKSTFMRLLDEAGDLFDLDDLFDFD